MSGRNDKDAKDATVLIATPNAKFHKDWSRGIKLRYALGAVARRSELEQRLTTLQPDILILDLELCQPEGIAAVPAIQRLSPSTKILMLTDKPDVREGIAVLKMGGKGYCTNEISPALLQKAIEIIREGQLWIERAMVPHLLEEPDSPAEHRPTAPPVSSERTDGRPPCRVLLVDDNTQFLTLCTQTLSSEAQVEIVGCARSGQEALEQVRALQPDLVLMDLVMPEMDGLQATQEIKKMPAPPLVIIQSMYDILAYHQATEDAGADGFIPKDKLYEELLPMIRRLVADPAPGKAMSAVS